MYIHTYKYIYTQYLHVNAHIHICIYMIYT